METTERVRDFIVDGLRWDGSPEQLTDDYPLIAGGVIDSLGLFRIVEFLEATYGVEIADEELLPESFETLRSIAKLVESKG